MTVISVGSLIMNGHWIKIINITKEREIYHSLSINMLWSWNSKSIRNFDPQKSELEELVRKTSVRSSWYLKRLLKDLTCTFKGRWWNIDLSVGPRTPTSWNEFIRMEVPGFSHTKEIQKQNHYPCVLESN